MFEYKSHHVIEQQYSTLPTIATSILSEGTWNVGVFHVKLNNINPFESWRKVTWASLVDSILYWHVTSERIWKKLLITILFISKHYIHMILLTSFQFENDNFLCFLIISSTLVTFWPSIMKSCTLIQNRRYQLWFFKEPRTIVRSPLLHPLVRATNGMSNFNFKFIAEIALLR